MANQSGGGDQKKKKGQGFNEMILGSMKSRSGAETTKWINNLTSENMEDIVEASVEQISPQTALPAQFSHPSIAQMQVKWVDRLFDLFQQYEVEFNRAVPAPELRVETERAVITPELIGRMQGSDHHHYSGRLHTRYWTLAIRGNLSSIEGYIMPSDHFIGFENNIAAYSQFFEFIPVWDGELKWSFDKGAIGYGQLPPIAKQLFGHLVKVAKGDADPGERFGASANAKVPPKPMGDADLAVASPAVPAPAADYLSKHGSVFDDNEAPLPSTAPSKPAPADRPRPGRAPVSSVVEKSAASEITAGGANLSSLTMAEACDLLTRSIDNELDVLSRNGAKAFESHNFAEVEKLMKRTAKLKAMREQIIETVNSWKKSLEE